MTRASCHTPKSSNGCAVAINDLLFCGVSFSCFAIRRKPSGDQLATFNLQPATLFLEIVEIVLQGALVGARDFFLTERALGVSLGGRNGFFVGDLALALDAHGFQREIGRASCRE